MGLQVFRLFELLVTWQGILLVAASNQYLQNFTVFVSVWSTTSPDLSDLCFSYSSKVPVVNNITFTCQRGLQFGRYITIKRVGGFRFDALSLCEIYVYDYIVGDIALNKETYQIGTYSSRGTNFNSSRAVDGDIDNCAAVTSGNLSKLWWMVDLGSTMTVTSVTLYNWNYTSQSPYFDGYNYLKEVTIRVGDDRVNLWTQAICSNVTVEIPLGSSSTYNCSFGLSGRFVSIEKWGSLNDDRLILCEVIVRGSIPTTAFVTNLTTVTTGTKTTSKITSAVPTTGEDEFVTNNSVTKGIVTTSFSPKNNNTTALTAATVNGLSNAALGAIIGVGVGVGVVVIGLVALFVCLKSRCPKFAKTQPHGRRQSARPIMVEDTSSVYGAPSSGTDLPNRNIAEHELGEYVSNLKNTTNGLQKEFKKLPDDTAGEAKLGNKPENRLKNRFTNVLPYDHTIVGLDIEEFDDKSDYYINASFIRGFKRIDRMYIAAQGPRPNTIDDFWRMIWQQKVNLVVMITQLIEKTKNKCEQYWPERLGDTRKYHKISVTLISQDSYSDYIERQLVIQDERHEEEPSRVVRHFQYLSWMDGGRPTHCFQLLSFRRKVKTIQSRFSSGPVVVHCSSGIGRTGAYIALDYLLDQLSAEHLVSVFGCVEELRRQRMFMVQTLEPYEFVYDAMVDEIAMGDTSISCQNFLHDYTGFNQTDTVAPMSKIEGQFTKLRTISEPKSNRKSAGLDPDNIAKHRNKKIVAYDDSRTYLDVSYISRTDYINAVSVNSYRSPHAYILTQVPLQDTIVDFWRLIWDYDIKMILLLDDLNDNSPRYWYENSGSRTFGPFLVELISTQRQSQNIIKREFILTNTKEKTRDSISVNQLQVTDWLKNPIFSSADIEMFLEMRKKLIEWMETQPTNERIVIQCMDGATKSGLFTAALHVIDGIQTEARVDVCLACRHVKIHRPTAIASLEHFSFLHEVASVCSQLSVETDTEQDSRLKRLSISTLYASVRSVS